MTVMAAGATVMVVSSLPYMTNGKVTHEDIKKTLSSFRNFSLERKKTTRKKVETARIRAVAATRTIAAKTRKREGKTRNVIEA